jgi:hypothetical protein
MHIGPERRKRESNPAIVCLDARATVDIDRRAHLPCNVAQVHIFTDKLSVTKAKGLDVIQDLFS